MFPSVTSAAELKLKDRDCDCGINDGEANKKSVSCHEKVIPHISIKKEYSCGFILSLQLDNIHASNWNSSGLCECVRLYTCWCICVGVWRALHVHVDSWGCWLQMQLNTPVNCVSTQEPDEHMNTTRTRRRAPHHVSNLLHTRMLKCCYCKDSPACTCSVFINLTASPQVEITLMGGNAWQTQTDTNKECYIAQGRSVIWCGDLEKRRYEWRVLRLRLMKRLMWLQRVAPSTVCHICCIYYTWRAANMMISILQTAVHNRTVKNLICSIWEVKLKSDALVFIDMHRHVLYFFQVSGEPALIYWEI